MRVSRGIAVAVVATSLAVVGAAPAWGSTRARADEPSDTYCSAFEEQYAIGLIIALASAFAGTGENGEADAKEARDTLLFVLSPKLERVTSDLVDDAPARVLRRLFRTQEKAYADAVRRLRDAGVTKEQIEALAELDLEAQDDPDAIVDRTDVDEEKIKRAAKAWAKKYEEQIDAEEAPPGAEEAYMASGAACGVFPDSDVECQNVVDEGAVEAIIGEIDQSELEPGSCKYESAENADGDRSEVKVEVYRTPKVFDDRSEDAQDQSVPNLGDEAVALEGLTGFSDLGFSTCGRTLAIRAGDRSVLVGACVRDADVAVAALTTLAEGVLDQL